MLGCWQRLCLPMVELSSCWTFLSLHESLDDLVYPTAAMITEWTDNVAKIETGNLFLLMDFWSDSTLCGHTLRHALTVTLTGFTFFCSYSTTD